MPTIALSSIINIVKYLIDNTHYAWQLDKILLKPTVYGSSHCRSRIYGHRSRIFSSCVMSMYFHATAIQRPIFHTNTAILLQDSKIYLNVYKIRSATKSGELFVVVSSHYLLRSMRFYVPIYLSTTLTLLKCVPLYPFTIALSAIFFKIRAF